MSGRPSWFYCPACPTGLSACQALGEPGGLYKKEEESRREEDCPPLPDGLRDFRAPGHGVAGCQEEPRCVSEGMSCICS